MKHLETWLEVCGRGVSSHEAEVGIQATHAELTALLHMLLYLQHHLQDQSRWWANRRALMNMIGGEQPVVHAGEALANDIREVFVKHGFDPASPEFSALISAMEQAEASAKRGSEPPEGGEVN